MIPKSYDRMSRRGLLLSMAGLNPWLPLRGHATPAGAPRPNIVVLLSDDMGWEQVGLNGGKEVRTPNIDRIAREGLKMSQFYVQPVCTPSRSCLLTGRYAWKTGTERRPTGSARQGMLRDERTVAEALREAGYATWMVGKWHLGEWQAGHLPRARGFDHHYGHYGALIDSYTHTRGGVLDWHRNGKPVVEEGYSTFPLAKEASSLIARHDGKRPFFLYLPFNAVHGPHMAPPDYLKKYEHLGGGRGAQCRGAQRAQMECLDVAVGRVLQAIRDKGVDRQTLVVFLNDNGGPRVVGANGPYRGFKSHYHEGGIRVPAAARWPGQIPAGGSTDEMLHAIDLFPTLCRLARHDLPRTLAAQRDRAFVAGDARRRLEVHRAGRQLLRVDRPAAATLQHPRRPLRKTKPRGGAAGDRIQAARAPGLLSAVRPGGRTGRADSGLSAGSVR